jgi:bifunctional non-homologous end joining protein LigD
MLQRSGASDAGWVHEVKFDGYRVELRIHEGTVTLRTRKGLDWSAKFGAIAREAASLPNSIIDGEIVAHDENGAPNFAALQAALSGQRTDDLVFYAFDLLFDGSGDLRSLPLSDRKAASRRYWPTGGAAIIPSSGMSSISRPAEMPS